MKKSLILSAMMLALGLTAQGQNIQERQDTITESVVVSQKRHRDNFTQTGMKRIDGTKLRGGYAAFSTPDIIKMLQTLPGVASGTELLSGLFVHGGDGSDNLFLLDGVPIYQVSHVAGLFSSFNTDMVDNMEFYKSGFPARYGGKLSSVVDVATRDGDFNEYHGTFSLGLIDGRLNFSGPIVKGRTSFNVGLRRSWMDVVTIPAVALINRDNNKGVAPEAQDKINFHYAFDDFNARLTHVIKPGSKLIFNAYQGTDGMQVEDREKSVSNITIDAPEIDTEFTQRHSEEDINIGVRWGNFTSSLAWDKEYSAKLHSIIKAYYTQSKSDISVGFMDKDDNSTSTIRENNITLVKDWSAAADFDWYPDSSNHIRAGAQYQYHVYHPSRNELIESVNSKYPESDYKHSNSTAKRYDGHEASLYAEDEISFSPSIKGNIGLRTALFGVPGKTRVRLEPRAAFKWQMADYASTRLSYSEMNQFNHLVATTYLDMPTNCWMPSTASVKPSLSRQLAGGFYFDWPMGMRLYLEGYYKTMEHLLEYGGRNAMLPPIDTWESKFLEGRGRAFGAELEWGYDLEKWSFTTYYTLSWSQRKFEDIYYTWYPDRNDNRHKINLNVTWKPKPSFELYAMWNYHSGGRITTASHVIMEEVDGERYDWETGETLPYTYKYTIDMYTRPNNLLIPDYHRLDLGFNFHRKSKRGNEVIWNLSIYNAYCRMNSIMAYVDRNDEGKLVEITAGIIPIIPTFSYTYKF